MHRGSSTVAVNIARSVLRSANIPCCVQELLKFYSRLEFMCIGIGRSATVCWFYAFVCVCVCVTMVERCLMSVRAGTLGPGSCACSSHWEWECSQSTSSWQQVPKAPSHSLPPSLSLSPLALVTIFQERLESRR
jgi:hypothetical protein